MKIFDCFSYWDEDLLLDLRLKILDEIVDYFVIVEGNKTWQGNKKKLKFNIKKFKNYKKKIIYVPVEDMPDGDNPWVRENFQRNCINRGLNLASDDDAIIISDLDEIPNPDAFKKFKKKMKYAVFKQKHYYYKFNLQSKNNPYWYGSRICIKKFLKSPQWLRSLKFKKRPAWRIDKMRLNNIIDNGGWHFCNLKTPEQLLYKYNNLCETKDNFAFHEQIDPIHLTIEEIQSKIRNGKDFIGRNHIYEFQKLDHTFPKYLYLNQNLYKKWIEN